MDASCLRSFRREVRPPERCGCRANEAGEAFDLVLARHALERLLCRRIVLPGFLDS